MNLLASAHHRRGFAYRDPSFRMSTSSANAELGLPQGRPPLVTSCIAAGTNPPLSGRPAPVPCGVGVVST